jgi:hypothetical protein
MFDFLNEAWVMCSSNGIECDLFRPVPVLGGNACGNGLKKCRKLPKVMEWSENLKVFE